MPDEPILGRYIGPVPLDPSEHWRAEGGQAYAVTVYSNTDQPEDMLALHLDVRHEVTGEPGTCRLILSKDYAAFVRELLGRAIAAPPSPENN